MPIKEVLKVGVDMGVLYVPQITLVGGQRRASLSGPKFLLLRETARLVFAPQHLAQRYVLEKSLPWGGPASHPSVSMAGNQSLQLTPLGDSSYTHTSVLLGRL